MITLYNIFFFNR